MQQQHSKTELLQQIKRVIEGTDDAKLNKVYAWYKPKTKEGCVAGICAQDEWFNKQGFKSEPIEDYYDANHVPIYASGNGKQYSWNAIDSFFYTFSHKLKAKLFGTRTIVMNLSKDEIIQVINEELEQIHA